VVVLTVASVKHAEEQTAGLSVVILIFGLTLAIEGGDAVEEELRDVGEGYGVSASDAFMSELLDEIAEEGVDATGGREISDVVEELVSGGFILEAPRFDLLANVMGAEGGVGIGGEHLAASTFAVDVLAGGEGQGLGSDGG
jgi:hypothetical protein